MPANAHHDSVGDAERGVVWRFLCTGMAQAYLAKRETLSARQCLHQCFVHGRHQHLAGVDDVVGIRWLHVVYVKESNQ